MIIAVDGPAASGKGTIARALAGHYALPHMDTGLLYRAVGLVLVRADIGDPDEDAALGACELDGTDFADPALRGEEAGRMASIVSAYPGVRAALIARQRDFANRPGGAVLDGRDIGTVIAPHADAKLFVTASPEVRARRRQVELGGHMPFEQVLADIRGRDARDAGRAAAPLARAEDAALLDTSAMEVSQAIAAAVGIVERVRSG